MRVGPATRHGSVIRLRPDKLEEYVRLHAAVWPEVLDRLHASGIRNYTIYLHDGWLFSHFEHVGDDYAADMAAIAAHDVTRQWWELTDPCQERLPGTPDGEQWTAMTEVFHVD